MYYLNGDYHIDFPRTLTIAGALWDYERRHQGFAAPDILRCQGPTTEPLILSVSQPEDLKLYILVEYLTPNKFLDYQNKVADLDICFPAASVRQERRH